MALYLDTMVTGVLQSGMRLRIECFAADMRSLVDEEALETNMVKA
jgi:hypothetical protein